MKADIKPGKYILAVSGGVDSMSLLDLLHHQAQLDLIVAHFDHGIRPSSKLDAVFVAKAARQYGLAFELGQAQLGSAASEAVARAARYDFLFKMQQKYEADAIVTAHHQDDLLETAVLNLLRGTGPAGLIAMAANPKIKRPLLKASKADILAYARANKLVWREDETNQSDHYRRNYIRRNLLTKLGPTDRQKFIQAIDKVLAGAAEMAGLIDELAAGVISGQAIDRQSYTGLPVSVGRTILKNFLENNGVTDLDRSTLVRLDLAIRTGRPGSKLDIKSRQKLKLSDSVAMLTAEKLG